MKHNIKFIQNEMKILIMKTRGGQYNFSLKEKSYIIPFKCTTVKSLISVH